MERLVMENIINELNIVLKKNDTLVLAISGGPDSMCLMDLILKIRDKKPINIVCAHINHGVRKASEKERKFVEEYCLKNNVVFEYSKLNISFKNNFHNEARKLRYHFFEHVVLKHDAKYLMTAHHGDDLIETILMRIVRGSSLKGYSGFKSFLNKGEYVLYRPLVSLSKEKIINYCKINKIKYVKDLSNFKEIYTRNRFRKYLLPMLKKEDTNVHMKFLKYSKNLEDAYDFIDSEVSKKYEELVKENTLLIDKFVVEQDIIKKSIIQKMLEKQYTVDLNEISDDHVDKIINLIESKKTNSSINLPKNIVAIKNYGKFWLESKIKEEEYFLELTKDIILPNNRKITFEKSNIDNSNNSFKFNSKDVKLPLYVRTKRSGDKMSIKGTNGSKKVSDIFIDGKVKPSDRNKWPLVVDTDGNIIWIPGLKKSKIDNSNIENCDIILRYH
jgi:tRNA(Ile)-lysidine synthase